MKQAIIQFHHVPIKANQLHQLRGYIGRHFQQHDLIHNHDCETGKHIYRYPLIQFKLIDQMPSIIAITDQTVHIFSELFMNLDQIVLNHQTLSIKDKTISIQDVPFGFADEFYMYEFVSPWIALNRDNYHTYRTVQTQSRQYQFLQSILIGNILSMCKTLHYTLAAHQKIQVTLNVDQTKVTLKKQPMIGFKGFFKINFLIPDYLGIGKSVSRGFGTVRRLL